MEESLHDLSLDKSISWYDIPNRTENNIEIIQNTINETLNIEQEMGSFTEIHDSFDENKATIDINNKSENSFNKLNNSLSINELISISINIDNEVHEKIDESLAFVHETPNRFLATPGRVNNPNISVDLFEATPKPITNQRRLIFLSKETTTPSLTSLSSNAPSSTPSPPSFSPNYLLSPVPDLPLSPCPTPPSPFDFQTAMNSRRQLVPSIISPPSSNFESTSSVLISALPDTIDSPLPASLSFISRVSLAEKDAKQSAQQAMENIRVDDPPHTQIEESTNKKQF